MTTSPPQTALFAPTYYERVDLTTQITRLPGTCDAPCHCDLGPKCRFPFNPDCWKDTLAPIET
jgi:hypothetical protein